MAEAVITLVLGAIVGMTLGALGAGGSILTIPMLVLVLGETPHNAAETSLVVVGTTALAGAVAHARRGSVRVKVAVVFTSAGALASLCASWLASRTAADTLTLLFSGVMLLAAAMTWRATMPGVRAPEPPLDRRHAVGRTLAAGSAVGALTGYFGIGGGFLAVPALTWALALPLADAVGTSLLVIALNAGIALAPRLTNGLSDTSTTALFVVGGVLGAWGGTGIVHSIRPETGRRAFAIVVAVLAMALAVQAVA